MKYVLDSCVALKWVLPEGDSQLAIDVREAGHELIAPDIFPFEICHVLSKEVRSARLTADDALRGMEAIQIDEPLLFSSHDLLPRAMAIALEARCSLWDSFYLALAESEGCELLTADAKLVRNVQHKFKFVVLLS